MQLDISDNSWKVFLEKVKSALGSNKAYFYSPVQGRQYQIKEITETNTIVVKRTTGEESRFNKEAYFSFLKEVNDGNGIIYISSSGFHRVKLTTIVEFHSQLYFQNNGKEVHIKHSDKEDQIIVNGKLIPDDDINLKRLIATKIRKGQKQFRDALKGICSSSCCISNTSIEQTLDACHIESHAKNGINQVGNGLLLRADLHYLFDYKLLFIEPQTHRVHLHKDLSSSEYWIYNGKTISIPHVDDKYLADRWNEKIW